MLYIYIYIYISNMYFLKKCGSAFLFYFESKACVFLLQKQTEQIVNCTYFAEISRSYLYCEECLVQFATYQRCRYPRRPSILPPVSQTPQSGYLVHSRMSRTVSFFSPKFHAHNATRIIDWSLIQSCSLTYQAAQEFKNVQGTLRCNSGSNLCCKYRENIFGFPSICDHMLLLNLNHQFQI
jgi:hypothetical protein